MLSTYCFVEACNASVGSCVSVTVVRPASVVEVPPSAMLVEPIVTDELVRPLFGIVATAVNALVPLPNSQPESVVAPVPPLATGNVPVTPVVRGRPVAFVSVTAEGVPRFGVVSVGDVARTMPPLPVTA